MALTHNIGVLGRKGFRGTPVPLSHHNETHWVPRKKNEDMIVEEVSVVRRKEISESRRGRKTAMRRWI